MSTILLTLLRKTREAFNKEAAELKDDLDDKMKEKKVKLDQVGTATLDLQSGVTARLGDLEKGRSAVYRRRAKSRESPKRPRAADKTKAVKLWKEKLDAISGQLAKFTPIETADFNKAVQAMTSKGKK